MQNAWIMLILEGSCLAELDERCRDDSIEDHENEANEGYLLVKTPW